MKCDKCGYSDNGSGDWAHICGPVEVKKTPMVIFDRHYSDESLIDLDEDICWALEKDFAEIPKDEHGFSQGEFRVTITWSEE